MEELNQIIHDATAAVNSDYFTLDIAGGTAVFRERVDCYELYHQMRRRWPQKDACRFILSGEVDKAGHALLQELGADGAKPDLLVHRPGHMEDNLAIIEVKHSTALEGIRKDLATLDLFIRNVKYQRAIYLIYGGFANERTAERICAEAKELGVKSSIEIWLHDSCGSPAVPFNQTRN